MDRQYGITRRIIEILDYDFGWMRALERARLQGVPDVSAVKIYNALNKRVSDITLLYDVMRDLGCKCDDDEDGERCMVVRVVEVDDDRWIVDEHPSEG
jgi:hypothetical protein